MSSKKFTKLSIITEECSREFLTELLQNVRKIKRAIDVRLTCEDLVTSLNEDGFIFVDNSIKTFTGTFVRLRNVYMVSLKCPISGSRVVVFTK